MDDLISRQGAIDVAKEELDNGTFYDIPSKIESLPPAQPELIEQGAYVRGFEQGRTQGMIDNTIKAEWTNADALNLQPTCNQLATDRISRQAAIDGMRRGAKMLEYGFYNMDCMEGMKEFPDKYFDLAIVDPPYGDPNGGGGGTDLVSGSTATRIHKQQKNCRKPDGTWGYPNWWNVGEQIPKKSLRGTLPRKRNTLTNFFVSHGIRLSGGATISNCRRQDAF